MKRLSKWLWDNPGKTILVICLIDLLFILAMSQLFGCAPKPPHRFENGDRTVYGPKTWGEVDEPDMAHEDAL